MSNNIFTVSDLNNLLEHKLMNDYELKYLIVEGEISNFKISSGHFYFDLKDENSKISCNLWKSYTYNLNFKPKDGQKVRVKASINFYKPYGRLSLNCIQMEEIGQGALFKKYLELKEKLDKEGLFNEEYKKELPTLYPFKVAILCGKESAALSDIKKTFKLRWPVCKIDIYEVTVQGENAPSSIINTLNKIDNLDYEIIILTRGGGSFEDLFCFNDEQLVRTIFNLQTYIVCAIGHEKDITLSELVADLRASTPTQAVERITPLIDDVLLNIESCNLELRKNINFIYNFKLNELDSYNKSLSKFNEKIKFIEQAIINNQNRLILSAKGIIKNALLRINYNLENIKKLNENIYRDNYNKLKRLTTLLNAYSKENILSKGYSLVFKDNELIKDSKSLNKNDLINIELKKGSIKAEIKEVHYGK